DPGYVPKLQLTKSLSLVTEYYAALDFLTDSHSYNLGNALVYALDIMVYPKNIIMGAKHNQSSHRPRSPVSIFVVLGLCCLFYLLGAWRKSGFGKEDSIAMRITQQTDCSIPTNLDFEPHHKSVEIISTSEPKAKVFEPCDAKYTDYTPCQEQDRAMTFPRENMIYRERHCPPEEEKLCCLVPAPEGYTAPFPWPKSRDYVYYANVPYKSLTVEKAVQNWVQFQGNVFKFPGGGTMFPQGADAYIDELASVIPIADGSVRTALDTGCGVASWGAYMLKRNVLTMSFAPRDNHEAQVQFALERGVPAVIGVLGSIRLPYPSRAFDIAQCSRCLIPWTANDGMYLMEVDRVLRPGGYWVLSGPPINWKTYYKTWKRSKEDLRAEQQKIEDLAESLCWEKKYEKGDIAIFRKKLNDESCQRNSATICEAKEADDVKNAKEIAGGKLRKFPDRLFSIPPRIAKSLVPDVTVESYEEDNQLWKKRVRYYKRSNSLLGTSRYRNVMDMNAGLGGFAAALESPKLWVMNVVPNIAKNTLGVIYERGLIGIYHDWCEGFSTYPRTYDLIHGSGVFSLYDKKCNLEDILLEMDRILRPGGLVILRDEVDVLNKVKKIVGGMRWEAKLMDHEDGPLVPEKILVAVKQYWVVGSTGNNTTDDR
ncbi:putative S-adenosyl-L-methionine-dependent methyltransferase, partial [Dillenia turbinata]